MRIMGKDNVNMLSGPITKGLLAMTMPIMVMNLLSSLFNVVDMTALKMFGFARAVGAVGACSTLITLCTSLLTGTSTGANVIVARRIGSGNKEQADRAAMTALLFSSVGGLVMMVIGIVFAETFLNWINCPETLLPQATTYFRLYFLGVPAIMFHSFSASILRATGDTKRPFYYSVIGGLTKIVLTVFSAGVLHVGVEGIASATIICQLLMDFLFARRLIKFQSVVKIDFHQLVFDFKELKAMLRIGVPTGVQTALCSFANTVIATAVNSFGEAATTGISIANQFDNILYQIIHAPSLAVMPFIAQNMGAGNLKRMKATIWRGALITIAFGATLGALSAGFSTQLSSLMSDSAEVIAFSRQKMIIISSTYFLCGINEVMGGVLRGIGRPIIPTISALLFMCALRFVWVYAIFPLIPNLTFLYAVWPVGWILSIIMLSIAYFIAMGKHERKLRAASPAQ